MKPRTGIVATLIAGAVGALGAAGTANAFTPAVDIVDTVPPVVPVPVATLDENSRTVTLSAPATDDRSGIASYVWTAGDGTPPQVSTSSQFVHVYPSPGTFSGTVTVTDGVGNAASQGFTVAVVDHTAPRLAYMLVEPGVLATHKVRVVLAPTERTTATITATVRAAGRTYRLPVARRQLFPGRFTGVRIDVRREVREAIARAMARHLPVQARASVALLDRAGNPSSGLGSSRITG